MRRLLAALHVIPTEYRAVVVAGESGTGRSRVAAWIDQAWWPQRGATVIECGMDAALVEQELTRMRSAKRPRTLILDHVDSLERLRSRLLDLRRDKRIGKPAAWSVVATCLPASAETVLEAMRSAFGSAPRIHVPPLRERREDLSALVRALLEPTAPDDRPPTRISASAMDALASYHWPGNVTELQEVLARSLLAAGRDPVLLEHLPCAVRRPHSGGDYADETLESVERIHILSTLQRYHGHRGKSASALGIHPNTLLRRLASYGLGRRRRRTTS